MNPLSKHAKLFVGNFKVKIDNATALRVDDLVGIQTNGSYITLETVSSKDDPDAYPTYFKPSEVTLIARPIESLSDEEKDQIWQTLPNTSKTWREHRESHEEYVRNVAPTDIEGGVHMSSELEELEDIIMSFTPATLEALSLSVYPGPQEDFGDTVIDTRTLTNA